MSRSCRTSRLPFFCSKLLQTKNHIIKYKLLFQGLLRVYLVYLFFSNLALTLRLRRLHRPEWHRPRSGGHPNATAARQGGIPCIWPLGSTSQIFRSWQRGLCACAEAVRRPETSSPVTGPAESQWRDRNGTRMDQVRSDRFGFTDSL